MKSQGEQDRPGAGAGAGAGKRETEPMPASFKPAWMLLLGLLAVTALIALAAAVIDRLVLG